MTKELIEELRNTFEYHPDGYLIRKSTGRPCGQNANTRNGYATVNVDGRILKAHRVIYAIIHGNMPDGEIDHLNGDRVDNRIENLRDVSSSENQHNSKNRKDNSSGYQGVSWHTQCQKWRVYINVDNRRIYLGLFEDFEEAVQVRKLAKIRYHPISLEAAKFNNKSIMSERG